MTQMPFGPPEHHDRRWREPRLGRWVQSRPLWALFWLLWFAGMLLAVLEAFS